MLTKGLDSSYSSSVSVSKVFGKDRLDDVSYDRLGEVLGR